MSCICWDNSKLKNECAMHSEIFDTQEDKIQSGLDKEDILLYFKSRMLKRFIKVDINLQNNRDQ